MRRPIAIATLFVALAAAACGGGGGPDPSAPPSPASEPAVGVEQNPTGFAGQARDVAGQVDDRTALLEQLEP